MSFGGTQFNPQSSVYKTNIVPSFFLLFYRQNGGGSWSLLSFLYWSIELQICQFCWWLLTFQVSLSITE